MAGIGTASFEILIIVTPYFNAATTMAFVDPFRAANYLAGQSMFRWSIASHEGGEVPTSSGLSVATEPIKSHHHKQPDLVVVSSSWTPEQYSSGLFNQALIRWSRNGAMLGALDTGTFVLAKAGLLGGKRVTVHYEHIDAVIELFPDLDVSEDLFVIDGNVFTCCGGVASVDIALHLLRDIKGISLSNAVARYIFHHDVRGPSATQNPKTIETTGHITPSAVRRAVDLMEANLETPLTIPEICVRLNISQRQLSRLFKRYVRKSAALYYRDIRLDRARGLVTQTELKLSEVAVASGFNSQVHFSRAYNDRFGLPPRKDRIEGRVPFEFRAWPMHDPDHD
ncbi:MAG: GlxA family transcriptional regulator [Pseudomonadota bacterium]